MLFEKRYCDQGLLLISPLLILSFCSLVSNHNRQQGRTLCPCRGRCSRTSMESRSQDRTAISANMTAVAEQDRDDRQLERALRLDLTAVVPSRDRSIMQVQLSSTRRLSAVLATMVVDAKATLGARELVTWQCSICLVGMDPSLTFLRLECGHSYHHECLEQWLRQHDSCPECRRPVCENVSPDGTNP